MLELNKEYTYKQIIELLGWEEKGGNSKIAQINEIESAYEFYHPMNKKTHKEKKSYIFTEQYREPVEPSKSNCGGSRNNKNIKPMIEYIQAYVKDEYVGYSYYSMTDWYCEILGLLNKEICNVVYMGDDVITDYCKRNGIINSRLLRDYISMARSILKDIFLKSLLSMEKQDLCEFNKGYIFIYQMSRKTGFVGTDILNDLIIANETTICNEMKEEYNLSDKLKGRQLLMQIYGRKDLTDEFNDSKILELMEDEEAIGKINEMMRGEYGCSYTPVDADHPLINYYGGVMLQWLNFSGGDVNELGKQVCSIIRNKTQKAIYSKYWKCGTSRNYIYNELEHSSDICAIEKLLFRYDTATYELSAEDIAEIEELFAC